MINFPSGCIRRWLNLRKPSFRVVSSDSHGCLIRKQSRAKRGRRKSREGCNRRGKRERKGESKTEGTRHDVHRRKRGFGRGCSGFTTRNPKLVLISPSFVLLFVARNRGHESTHNPSTITRRVFFFATGYRVREPKQTIPNATRRDKTLPNRSSTVNKAFRKLPVVIHGIIVVVFVSIFVITVAIIALIPISTMKFSSGHRDKYARTMESTTEAITTILYKRCLPNKKYSSGQFCFISFLRDFIGPLNRR